MTPRLSTGELERRVLEVMWARGEAMTPRDVHTVLVQERELAYTTVMTILVRLWKKGDLGATRSVVRSPISRSGRERSMCPSGCEERSPPPPTRPRRWDTSSNSSMPANDVSCADSSGGDSDEHRRDLRRAGPGVASPSPPSLGTAAAARRVGIRVHGGARRGRSAGPRRPGDDRRLATGPTGRTARSPPRARDSPTTCLPAASPLESPLRSLERPRPWPCSGPSDGHDASDESQRWRAGSEITAASRTSMSSSSPVTSPWITAVLQARGRSS